MDERGRQLQAVEHERLRALGEVDTTAAGSLHADDFRVITPQGGTVSKEDYLGALAAGDIHYARFEPTSEIEVLLSDDIAVTQYQPTIAGEFFGQRKQLHCWHTNCYRHSDRGWQIVWAQETAVEED